jgi:predicted transcriptional regulator
MKKFSPVIEQAVKDYVSLEEWRLAAIDEGLRAADEGRVASQGGYHRVGPFLGSTR